MAKVIITGGTGLVGRRLTTLLENSGWQVSILCRKPAKPNEYAWDINRQTMDEKVLEGATAIIHLAGAGIADERWTDRRKQEIVDSRVQSAQLINSYLQKYPHTISHFISASAVGYYGDRGEEWLTENSSPGTGFVAEVCTAWEAAADALQSATVKVSKVRIGIVLSKDGGALPKLALPVKMGIGATMGNGKQYMPWIHIDDLCGIFRFLLEHPEKNGIYNACAPNVCTQQELMKDIATVLHRPYIPFPVPAAVLKLGMGEMAGIVLMSNRCEAGKISAAGYPFIYTTAKEALQAVYS